MSYPAIVYNLNDIENQNADNQVYLQQKEYTVIVIDTNPDSSIADKVSMIPTASFDRAYKSDNIDHFSYTVKY